MIGEQSVELTQYLKELRLPAIRDCYKDLAEQAREEALSYELYLFGLVETEREARRQNRIARLLREWVTRTDCTSKTCSGRLLLNPPRQKRDTADDHARW